MTATPVNMSTLSAQHYGYLTACHRLANDPVSFARFRQDPQLCAIYEHASAEEAQRSLAFIKKHTTGSFIRNLEHSDAVGSPRLVTLSSDGQQVTLSPSTLRYGAVAADIHRRVGSWTDMNIIEIGGGYGGQCQVLCQSNPPHSYTLVDLLEPLAMQRRYLDHFSLGTQLTLQTLNELPIDRAPGEIDLVIANYSISEMTPELQNAYIHKVIRHARHGYIRYNHIKNDMGIRDAAGFCGVLPPRVTIAEEYPQTYPGNMVIYW